MKVYITFESDPFGGRCIDKVFAVKDDAIRYIIENVLKVRSYYREMPDDTLRKAADLYIEECDVEGC